MDDAEDSDVVMPMYNLLVLFCHNSQFMALLFYSKNESINFNVNIVGNNSFKSLKYKTRLIGNTVADGANGILRNTAVTVS